MYNKVKEEKMVLTKESIHIQDKGGEPKNLINSQSVPKKEQKKRIKTLATAEKERNLKRDKVHVPTMTHSQGSTSRPKQDKPHKSTNLTQKKTTEEVVSSRKTQDLKRKFTTTVTTESGGCNDFQQNLNKDIGKSRKYSVMSIDNFLQVNNKHDEGEEQLDVNEDVNPIEEQDEHDINQREVEDHDKTIEGTSS